MSKSFWIACAVVFVLGSGWGGTASFAQPPDSPNDATAESGDAQAEPPGGITLSLDLFTGKVSLSFSLPWGFLQGRLPDGAATQHSSAPMGRSNSLSPPRGIPVPRELDRPTLLQEQARTMFEIAERCLKNGDIDKARTCYEETHLLAPETRYGRRAIQRLADIDNARVFDVSEGTEEQEPRGQATKRPRD